VRQKVCLKGKNGVGGGREKQRQGAEKTGKYCYNKQDTDSTTEGTKRCQEKNSGGASVEKYSNLLRR